MTETQLRDWQARWRLVEARQREELQRASLERKAQQLAALMASVDAFGWREELEAGDAEVRARWRRLREAARARG